MLNATRQPRRHTTMTGRGLEQRRTKSFDVMAQHVEKSAAEKSTVSYSQATPSREIFRYHVTTDVSIGH